MRTSEQIDQIGAALAQAQAEMQHAAKDANNPHFKSKYADLASVMDACRPALAKAKVAVVQSPELVRETKTVRVTTRLIHASGQWVEATLEADVAKTDPQAIGSAITYLRRYGLASLASVAADDDDGNGAVGRERFEGPREVRREEPRREEVPPTALREAFEKTVGAFPHCQAEANRIFTATQTGPEDKLADLRALYAREHKAAAAKAAAAQSAPAAPAPAAPAPANNNAKPDPKTAELRKRISRLVEAAKREGLSVEQTLSEFGALDQVSPADLAALVSELEAVLNGRAA